MEKDYKEKCFAELEKEVRIKLPNIPSVQDWYEEMRYRKLSEFNASDLARAIRHKIFLEFTVPAALEKMAMESVITGSYYGELMFELLNIPRCFWEQHEEFADNLRVMIEEFLDRVEELTMVAKAIIGRLSRVYPWMAQRSEKSKESLFYTISHELLFYKKEQAEAVVNEIQKKGYEVWLEKADRGYKVIVTKCLPIDKKFCDIINEFDNELEELSERFSGNLE